MALPGYIRPPEHVLDGMVLGLENIAGGIARDTRESVALTKQYANSSGFIGIGGGLIVGSTNVIGGVTARSLEAIALAAEGLRNTPDFVADNIWGPERCKARYGVEQEWSGRVWETRLDTEPEDVLTGLSNGSYAILEGTGDGMYDLVTRPLAGNGPGDIVQGVAAFTNKTIAGALDLTQALALGLRKSQTAVIEPVVTTASDGLGALYTASGTAVDLATDAVTGVVDFVSGQEETCQEFLPGVPSRQQVPQRGPPGTAALPGAPAWQLPQGRGPPTLGRPQHPMVGQKRTPPSSGAGSAPSLRPCSAVESPWATPQKTRWPTEATALSQIPIAVGSPVTNPTTKWPSQYQELATVSEVSGSFDSSSEKWWKATPTHADSNASGGPRCRRYRFPDRHVRGQGFASVPASEGSVSRRSSQAPASAPASSRPGSAQGSARGGGTTPAYETDAAAAAKTSGSAAMSAAPSSVPAGAATSAAPSSAPAVFAAGPSAAMSSAAPCSTVAPGRPGSASVGSASALSTTHAQAAAATSLTTIATMSPTFFSAPAVAASTAAGSVVAMPAPRQFAAASANLPGSTAVKSVRVVSKAHAYPATSVRRVATTSVVPSSRPVVAATSAGPSVGKAAPVPFATAVAAATTASATAAAPVTSAATSAAAVTSEPAAAVSCVTLPPQQLPIGAAHAPATIPEEAVQTASGTLLW